MKATRRQFIKLASVQSLLFASGVHSQSTAESDPDSILGHGDYRYKQVKGWGVLDSTTPVKDCHGMVMTSKGQIILLTNEIKNNVILYTKEGRLQGTWTQNLPGAHGLTLVHENGEEFLFITDSVKGRVIKTTLDGKIIKEINPPQSVDQKYRPTHVVVAPDGSFYILDGYASSLVYRFDHQGNLLSVFGGKGNEDRSLNCCHGGSIDTRYGKTTLLITSRENSCLKRFTLDGEYLETIHMMNSYPCFPIIKGEVMYIPQLREADKKAAIKEKSGFISILNKENKIISNPGGGAPTYDESGKLQALHVNSSVFMHPHHLLVDSEESLYIPQWNSEKTYPIKLVRI